MVDVGDFDHLSMREGDGENEQLRADTVEGHYV